MTLHPQALRALALWAQGPQVTDPGFGPEQIASRREAAREAAATEHTEPVGAVAEVDADGVPCRLYRPAGVEAPGVLVYLHGGGFVFGDLDTHDAQSRRLANRTGLAVLAVDYRRPPEHPFPAAVQDTDTAWAWLLREGEPFGLDLSRPVVLGDSAGANLALGLALRHPTEVGAVVLVYPFLDPELAAPSYEREDGGGLSRAEARWYWEQYVDAPGDLAHPDLAPLRSDAARLARLGAPVLVQAAEHDPLVDEDRLLADRLRESGVDVTLSTYPGMVHGFWRHPQLFDAAEEALAEIAAFLRDHR
ncbi:MAG: alpha/beta hydrolase [Actinomycetes bacterium]